MSEIVIIKTTGQVGVVRSVLTNSATGEEVVEVQPVGRAHGFNRFVPRADVETAGIEELKEAATVCLIASVREVRASIYSELDENIEKSLDEITDAIRRFRYGYTPTD